MATELDDILESLCEREERSGCYECTLAGINVYNIVRFQVRNYYLTSKGLPFVDTLTGINHWHYIKSIVLSAYHLCKLRIQKKKYESLFYPFLRLDNVEGTYLDKFTDPVIECSGIKENYIILERGRRGEHPTPRFHNNKVVYSNWLDICCELYARIFIKKFEKKYKVELDRLFTAIDVILEGVDNHRSFLTNRIAYNIYSVKLYKRLFKRLGVKKIFAPARASILCITYVARHLGISVYEFQHGITYGETALYSGYRDPSFTPDFFLAYGNTPPRSVYGIEEEKIINIGWAFQDFLEKLSSGQEKQEKSVLVISNPCTTDKVLKATFYLAEAFKDWQFVVRPHPVEVVTQEHIKAIAEHENVSLQDWHINVALAMQSFDHIIGESSTVLYEALNDGKKVARFCFNGFTPEYLNPEDEDCFWKVYDSESFKAFIQGKPEDKKSMKIYSKFDKELFLKLYNS